MNLEVAPGLLRGGALPVTAQLKVHAAWRVGQHPGRSGRQGAQGAAHDGSGRAGAGSRHLPVRVPAPLPLPTGTRRPTAAACIVHRRALTLLARWACLYLGTGSAQGCLQKIACLVAAARVLGASLDVGKWGDQATGGGTGGFRVMQWGGAVSDGLLPALAAGSLWHSSRTTTASTQHCAQRRGCLPTARRRSRSSRGPSCESCTRGCRRSTPSAARPSASPLISRWGHLRPAALRPQCLLRDLACTAPESDLADNLAWLRMSNTASRPEPLCSHSGGTHGTGRGGAQGRRRWSCRPFAGRLAGGRRLRGGGGGVRAEVPAEGHPLSVHGP